MTFNGLSGTVTRFFFRTKSVASVTTFCAVVDDRVVVGMLLGQFVEHGRRHFFLVVQRRLIGVREILLVERQRGFVDRRLRRSQIGLRPFHDFFDRQIGGERETKFLPELVHPEPEIAVGARQQIVCSHFLYSSRAAAVFSCKRRELLLHLRRAIEQRIETFAHEADRALHLIDRGFGVNLRRMFQIRFRLRDDGGNPFHSFAQIRDAFFRRIEIARDEQVEAVGQALIVDERVPIFVLQFLEIEDLVIDIVLQDAQIDAVRSRSTSRPAPKLFSFSRNAFAAASSFARVSGE